MKKMKFRFDKTIVEINGTIINIEISSKEDMVMFSKKHLSNFKEKYKNFHFNVTGPKNLICTNKGDYNVINNKKDFIGTKLTTVAKLVSVNESLINGDYQYELFFNNYYNTTGFRAILKTRNKTKFRLLSAYRIKGNFINEKRDLKDYEKEMKYIPAFLNLHTIEELADEEVIYNRFYEYEAKRFPMTGYSKYSKGFLDEIQIKEMKLSKKISNLCITDTNTLNWVEKINENCPLGLEAYFYDDEEDIEVAQKFSVQIYINSKDSEITRLNKTIVVNEGIRAVNEMISNSTIHKGCYLFKLSDVIKYRTMDLIRLGSLNKNGFVFKTLLESRYGYLNMYANIFDYYGIEPFSNTSKVVYDGKMTFSRLKDINNKIHKLGKLKNKKVLFCDNGVVADAKDREVIKYYLLSKKLTPIAKKNRRDIDLLKMEYPEHRIPYIHSFNEAWEELNQQGFADDEVLEILINEKEVFISLPQKKEITVIPQSLITDTSLESRTEFKNECLKAFREKYCPETQKMLAKRLKLELGIIISKGYENLFMTAKAVTKRVFDKGYIAGERGTGGNLFVTYLLGITNINPLPSHRFCKKCKKITKDEICTCGEKTEVQGWDLDYRMFFGPDLEKVPDLDINIPKEIIKEITEEFIEVKKETSIKASIVSYAKFDGIKSNVFSKIPDVSEMLDVDYASNFLKNLYQRTQIHNSGVILCPSDFDMNYITPMIEYEGERIPGYDYHKLDKTLIKIDLLSKNGLGVVKDLSLVTNIENIPFDDPKIYEMINNLETEGISEMNTDYFKNIISVVKPKCFLDIVKMQGLSHGNGIFKGNADIRIGQGKPYIALREDLVSLLKHYKVEGYFDIMEKIRKGKIDNLSKEQWEELNKLPEDWLSSVKKIKYLFPKTHAIAYARSSYYEMIFKKYKSGIMKKKNELIVEKKKISVMSELLEEYGI